MRPQNPVLTLNRSIDAPAETVAPTAEQVELRVARAKNRWQTPLNESEIPQFPCETDRLYTAVEPVQPKTPVIADIAGKPQALVQSFTIQLSKPLEMPMSPSVYSRNTDGASILPTDSDVSFNGPRDDDHAEPGGSAVILTSQSVRSYVIGTPSPPKRLSSTRSSRDWKTWLSHEVSAIGTSGHEDLTISEQYATPSQRHKCDVTQTVRTSHTGSDNTTVIVGESFELSTPRAGPFGSISLDAEQLSDKSVNNQERMSQALVESSDPGDLLESLRESSTSYVRKDQAEPPPTILSTSPLLIRNVYLTSTPSSTSSGLQPSLDTPSSARMNDRFPYLDTGKRSSSNNSRRSLHSKSPVSSEASSLNAQKESPRPQAIYSDLSPPATGTATTRVPHSSTRSQIPSASKENVAPNSVAIHRQMSVSPLGWSSRPTSLQPLPSSVLHRGSPSAMTHTAGSAGSVDSPNPSFPEGTLVSGETVVARPSLRVTVRPLSPNKLSRRPQSAFDLRSSTSPRSASEIHRSVLRSKPSSRVSAHGLKPDAHMSPPVRNADTKCQHDDSVTPGQRMADRFLKERKSTTVLERGVRKSTGRLVREDTPAFL